MSQTVFAQINPNTTSGSALAQILNDFKDAMMSGLSGTSRPSETEIGGTWVDTSVANTLTLKMYDGSTDISLITVNSLTGTATMGGSSTQLTITKKTDDNTSPILKYLKSRVAGGGQTLLNDVGGTSEFYGISETSIEKLLGDIRVICAENTTDAAHGGKISFRLTDVGGTTLNEVLTINSDGDVVALNKITAPTVEATTLSVSGNATITGDLTVNGTQTILNTATVESEDANILLNKGGNQAAADTQVAGVTVSMSDATDAVLGYDSTLASKFKLGEVGNLKEIVDVSSTQTLTGKTIDVDSNTVSNIEVDNFKAGVLLTDIDVVHADDTTLASAKSIKSYADSVASGDVGTHAALTTTHGVVGTIVGTSDVQTLTNKTLQGASIETPTRLDAKQDTKANLDTYASTASNGQLVFATDLKKTYQVVDNVLKEIGGGKGGINYLENGDFEDNTTGWTDDTNFEISRNTTDPLRGIADGKLSKGAVDASGEIIKTAFTIDNADKSKLLEISFSKNTSANYVDNDVHVKIYDVTAAAYISSNPIELKAGSSDFFCMFQASTNTSYELHFIVNSVSALAYDIFIDEVIARPFSGTRVLGNGKQYDLTVTGTGWTTTNAVGRIRLTDNLKWEMSFNITGARSGGAISTYTVSVAGVTFKNTGNLGQSISLGANNLSSDGNIGWGTANSNASTISVYFASGSPIDFYISGTVELASKPTFVNEADFPQLLDLSTREITASGWLSANQTIAGGFVKLNVDNNRGLENLTSGEYFASESGWYLAGYSTTVQAGATAPTNLNGYILVDGSSTKAYGRWNTTDLIANAYYTPNGTDIIYLNKGQKIGAYINSSTNGVTARGDSLYEHTKFWVAKLPRNQAAIISEKVIARYTTAAGQVVTTGNTTIIDFGTESVDTHDSVSTGTSWKFTAKKSGLYNVKANLSANIGTSTGSTYIYLYRNGSEYSVLKYISNKLFTSVNNDFFITGADLIFLNVGDYIDLRVLNGSNNVILTNIGQKANRISIESI